MAVSQIHLETSPDQTSELQLIRGSKTRARPRLAPLAVIVLCTSALTLKGFMALRSEIGPDEFQHLHAAWCIAQGRAPYVDFFEHHPPFLYYLLQPLFGLLEPGFELILAARGLMLALNVAVFCLVYSLAQVSFGRRTALWAPLFLASDVLFFERGYWVLTDVPAVVMTLTSTLCLTRAGQTRRLGWLFGASVALGSAVLFTPKVIYCGLGVSLWFAFYLKTALEKKRSRQWLRAAVAYLAGGVIPLALLLTLIGAEALPAFWESNVVLNAQWKARHSAMPHVRHMLVTNGPLWIAAAIGLAFALRRMVRRSRLCWRMGPVVLTFSSLITGAVLLPVVWEEYFVELSPYGAILGAYGLVRLMRLRASSTGKWTATTLAAVPVIALAHNLWRAVYEMDPLSTALVAATLCVLVGLSLTTRLTGGGHRAGIATCALVVLIVLPVGRQLTLVRDASNREHRAAVEFVMSQTTPHESVFDGYMGYGLFRPHAYWWWFLHDEVLLMLSEREKGEAILEALAEKRPKIVLYDWWIECLEPAVQEHLHTHYEPTAYHQIWILKDKSPACTKPSDSNRSSI